MVGSMPGQNPAQRHMQEMQQLRQRQMEYAWWKEHQQQQEVPTTFDTRPGFFVRFILGLISLALFAVFVIALIGAGWAVKDGMPQYVALGIGMAVVAGLLRRRVRRRARGL